MTATIFGAVFAMLFGAVIGSFLNACIYRLPRGISLLDPKRSFCPECKKTLSWKENIPLLSWLFLRGKCSGCRTKIPWRYPLVEVLTASLFVAVWFIHAMPLTPFYCAFVALLIAASFIDLDFMIIPDSLTLGGVASGVVFSVVCPAMMDVTEWWRGGLISLMGAGVGFAALWMVVEGGKWAFGRKRHHFDTKKDFSYCPDGTGGGTFRLEEETISREDIFTRKSDCLIVEGEGFAFAGVNLPFVKKVEFFQNRILADGKEFSLSCDVSGEISSIVIPREAMGFGDVKYIAAIGAFLGWQAVVFSILAGSVIGCLVAFFGMFLSRDAAGSRLPFGPFLSLGALIWVLGGSSLFVWYFSVFYR